MYSLRSFILESLLDDIDKQKGSGKACHLREKLIGGRREISSKSDES